MSENAHLKQQSAIERSVWTFKSIRDDDLKNENSEILLNFLEKSRFELNINHYLAELYYI
jgi:hypothetical protein